jgi:hypothetical protein
MSETALQPLRDLFGFGRAAMEAALLFFVLRGVEGGRALVEKVGVDIVLDG